MILFSAQGESSVRGWVDQSRVTRSGLQGEKAVSEESDSRTVSPVRQNSAITIRLGGHHRRLEEAPLLVPHQAGTFPPGMQAGSRHYASDSATLKLVIPDDFAPK